MPEHYFVSSSWRTEKTFPRPSGSSLKRLISAAADAAGLQKYAGKGLCVSFLSSRQMEKVNWEFLRHKGDTDVICFDYCGGTDDGFPAAEEPDPEEIETAVELLICPSVALRSAQKRDLPYSYEITLYLAHGLLHAAGYDDLEVMKKRRMRRAEKRVMKALESDFDLAAIFPAPVLNSEERK